MSLDLIQNPAPTSPPRALPWLRPARFEDYPQIQQLESAHGLLSLPAQDWHDLCLGNPLPAAER